MHKQPTAHRHEQANPTTLTIEQTQANAVVTDENINCPSSPRKLTNNANKPLNSASLSTLENESNELLATATATASYIAAPSQPRTEVQMELSFSRKFRRLESEWKQPRNQNDSPDVLATPESDSSSAFASGKGVHWAGNPEELAELTVGTREALRRVVREGRRRRVVRR